MEKDGQIKSKPRAKTLPYCPDSSEYAIYRRLRLSKHDSLSMPWLLVPPQGSTRHLYAMCVGWR